MQLLNISAQKETWSVTRDPSLQALTSHFLELRGLNKLTARPLPSHLLFNFSLAFLCTVSPRQKGGRPKSQGSLQFYFKIYHSAF